MDLLKDGEISTSKPTDAWYSEVTSAPLSLPHIASHTIIPKQGEHVLFESPAKLYRQQTTSHYVGGSRGVSMRIAKGVYVRTGRYKGRKISDSQLKSVDSGTLTLTTKHLYFNGSTKAVTIVLKSVSVVEVSQAMLHVTTGQRVHLFGNLRLNLFRWERYLRTAVVENK